jgi:hypothetical protein
VLVTILAESKSANALQDKASSRAGTLQPGPMDQLAENRFLQLLSLLAVSCWAGLPTCR